MKIVRACIFPTAIYGCEGWTLTSADEKKINAFETKCYRRILRIPWIEKKKPTEILKELKVGQDWLLNNIKARKLSYFGHLKRHDSLEKHILEARLEGKRRKGRPTRRWTEDIIRVFYFEFHKHLCFADSDLPYKKKINPLFTAKLFVSSLVIGSENLFNSSIFDKSV